MLSCFLLIVSAAVVCRYSCELKAKDKGQEEIRRARYMYSGAKPPEYEDGAKSVSRLPAS